MSQSDTDACQLCGDGEATLRRRITNIVSGCSVTLCADCIDLFPSRSKDMELRNAEIVLQYIEKYGLLA